MPEFEPEPKQQQRERQQLEQEQLAHQPETVESKKVPIFNIPIVVLLLIAFCVLVYAVPQYLFSTLEYRYFIAFYAFIPQLFGEYPTQLFYTPLSYSFMHGGVMHIVFNMLWLIVFGSPLANRIGVVRFLLFWCACAIIAALVHYCVYPDSMAPMVGASGAISGLMGAAARFGFRRIKGHAHIGRPEYAGPILSIGRALRSRNVIIFIGVWLGINVLIGVISVWGSELTGGSSASIAWLAHIGGLAAGFFLASFFDRRSRNL